ncbi:MAG: DegT/DnrJ/EryC1/StrS family aminotransferase, partial [Nanoarchaeota archaeon]
SFMDEKQLKDKCLKLLQQYTKHPIVKITNSGDTAIFGALSIAKQHGCKEVLIPDQGGWLSYKTFPKLLDMQIIQLKTTYGVIDPVVLNTEVNHHKNAALLFASFAGYAAPQDIEEIANICKENNILMIEDASGALTHELLCNGNLSDIIVGSFGKWKIADVGYGGFLSAKQHIITEEVKESDIFSLIKSTNMNYTLLFEKLKAAPQRLQFILKKTKEIKALCKKEHFSMIHENEEGLSIFVKWENEEEKEKILQFCKSHHLEYKECPLYIKVLEKAISIEVKRLRE